MLYVVLRYCVSFLAHGGWSAWGQWSACSSTCKVEGGIAPQQQRYRTCTNPPPSVSPRGNNCPDSDTGTQHCTGLPFCSGETCVRRLSYTSFPKCHYDDKNCAVVNRGNMSSQWMETGGHGLHPLNALWRVAWDYRHGAVIVIILHLSMEARLAQETIPKHLLALFQKDAQVKHIYENIYFPFRLIMYVMYRRCQ